MEYRLAHLGDLVKLVQYSKEALAREEWANAWPFDVEYSASVLAYYIENEKIYVAIDDSQIVGMTLVSEGNPSHTDKVKFVTLDHWNVHPDYKGTGVGSRLLEIFEALPYDTKYVLAPAGKKKLCRFLEKRGYRPEEIRYVKDRQSF